MATRYPAPELISFAAGLLAKAGLDADKAQTVAEILVEADLLGHTTHGLNLLAPYLSELEQGGMTKTGGPRVVADFPAAVTWDGRRLPGPWLTVKAFDLAMERARKAGTCTVVISRSHHIACLAAYLKRVADAGLLGILTCSAPDDRGTRDHGCLDVDCLQRSIPAGAGRRAQISSGLAGRCGRPADERARGVVYPATGRSPAGRRGRSWPQGLRAGVVGGGVDVGLGWIRTGGSVRRVVSLRLVASA